jgi:hypothetical protein
MAVGLASGKSGKDPLVDKSYYNAKAIEFTSHFTSDKKSLTCRELLGFDVRAPKDHMLPDVVKAKSEICPDLVAYATSLVENMTFE